MKCKRKIISPYWGDKKELEETNSKSIISIGLGILSIIVPFVGLFFGIIGLIMYKEGIKESNTSNEKDKGLVISARILSIVGICIQLLHILFGLLGIFSYGSISIN